MTTVKNIRLYNPQKFDVGVKLLDNDRGMNVRAGGFIQISENDVAYINSISSILRRGMLRVEKEKEILLQEVGIAPETDPNFIDDEAIRKKLSMSAKKVEEWLQTVQEEYIRDRIYDIAMEMNLPLNKIKVLQAAMPKKTFIEE